MLTLDKVEQSLDKLGIRKLFKRAELDNLVLYKYRVAKPDVFIYPEIRELRGIIFDKETGDIVSRPFHKFFNYGEKLCPVTEDNEGIITEKLDGTMIACTVYNDDLLISTTGSLQNEFIDRAREFINRNPQYEELIRDFEGYTIMFELVAPWNTIVIPYDSENLVLLSIRNIKTGDYLSQDEVEELARTYGINNAKIFTVDKIGNIVDNIKNQTGMEGVVVYTDVDLVKIKTHWYLQRHRARTHQFSKKEIVRLFINNELDDIYSFMSDDRKRFVDSVVNEVSKKINTYMEIIDSIEYDKFSSKKELAAFVNREIPREIRWIVFRKYDVKEFDTFDAVKKVILSLYK